MSIYIINSKRNGKRYGIRFRVQINGEEIHKNLSSFKTQAEAKRAQFEYVQKVEREQALKTPQSASKVLFEELAEMYKDYIADNLAPSSVYDYYNILETKILPVFGKMPIADVNKRVITEFQDKMPSDYSFKYKGKIRTVLSAVFTFAVNRDYVENNPVAKVERLRNNKAKPKMSFWTKEEFDQFIEVVDIPLYKALFTFLYLSGCRKGEAFGLLKDSINLKASTVLIDNTLTRRSISMAEKLGKTTSPKTKNTKIADIYMPMFSLKLIESQYCPGKYAFGGNVPLASTSVSRHFDKYIKLSGVKKIRLHDLRHSCATLIISLSNSELTVLYAIAERLRDSVEQILKTYGHLFPSKQAEIIKTLDRIYADKKE